MKRMICAGIGVCGAAISHAIGGWDASATILVSLMGIDYFTGFLTAAVFKKSKKTESGGYKSFEGFKGLVRKGMILLLVVVANLLEMQTGSDFIRDGVCTAFIVNEVVSIVENAALMGLKVPAVITKGLDILQSGKEG